MKSIRIVGVLLALVLLGTACDNPDASVMQTIADTPAGSDGSGLGPGSASRSSAIPSQAEGPKPVLAYYWGQDWVGEFLQLVYKRDLLVVFPDGRVSDDTQALVDPDAVAAEDWGTWTTEGSELKVHWTVNDYSHTYDAFYPPDGPSGKDLRLDGCWSGNTSGYNNFTFRTLCLNKDGQFEKSSATTVDGPFSSSTIIPADQRGTYRIDGYRITLNYASGDTYEFGFAVVDEEMSQLIVGSNDYFS